MTNTTQTPPAVSIAIVNWNTRELLADCLASIRVAAQDLAAPVETVVVDNNSSDQSAEMVGRDFPEVRLIANVDNKGFAGGTNQAIRAGSGGHVLLLNPDTVLAKSSLRILIETLESDPSAGAVGPRVFGAGGELQVTCFPLPTLGRELWRLLHLDRLLSYSQYPMRSWPVDGVRRVESLEGSCILFRREVLDRVGLLDETFFMYSEEIDLCRRVNEDGWKLLWSPAAEIVHYGGASTRKVALKMFVQLYRAKTQYFRKHGGRWSARLYKAILFVTSMPRIAAGLLARAWRSRRGETLRSIGGNYTALVRELGSL
jgi:GT2 family glycosyltransferase